MRAVNDDYRFAMFWALNDHLDAKRMESQMDIMLEAGVNCGFFHSRVGLVTPYMSEDWLDALEETCEALKARGKHAWIYDEDRFPSGYGGGEVTKAHPELAKKRLDMIPEAELEDDNPARRIGETAINGKKYVFYLSIAQNGDAWFNGGANVDTLDLRAMEAFLELVHEKYYRRLGRFFGRELKGVFFDEPSYIGRGKYPCVPWTDNMAELFQAKYGYSLLERLPELFIDEGDYRELRMDFYALATERFVEAFTVPYQKWCRERGILLTGHFIFEETLISQTECVGAVMPHYAEMDVPGIDILGLGNYKLATVLQIVSVAEQLGRPSICEVLGCVGHQSGPQEMKSVTDWLSALGVCLFSPHLTLYSSRGERKRDYPPNISWLQPWYNMAKGYFDHVARVGEAVQLGQSAVDILVVHPISSVWAELSPLHRKAGGYSIWDDVNPNARANYVKEVEAYQKPFEDLTARLCASGLFHHYGDELVMERRARVENGLLYIGRQAYRTVVVPPTCVLRGETAALLREFARQAGADALIFIEKYPDFVRARQTEWEFEKWSTLANNVDEALSYVNARAGNRVMAIDAITGAVHKRVVVQERLLPEGRMAFIANTGEREAHLTILLPQGYAPDALDTMNGDIRATHIIDGKISVRLAVGGSLMLLPASGAQKRAEYLQSGADFRSGARFAGVARPAARVTGENALPIDVVDFTAEGIEERDAPIESLWKRFYALPEGAPFEAVYRFYVKDVPEKACARIEMARNLTDIELNGVPVAIDAIAPEEGVFDFSYDRVALPGIRRGENALVLRGVKCNNVVRMATSRTIPPDEEHRPTELENVYICGNFRVESGMGAYWITADTGAPVQGDVALNGYPCYAGGLEYTVDIPENAKWMRVEADANACRVCAQGETQTALIQPFEFDLNDFIEKGAKSVKIELRNTLANVFGPLRMEGRQNFGMIGPAMIYDMRRYAKQPQLFPYGLKRITFMEAQNN